MGVTPRPELPAELRLDWFEWSEPWDNDNFIKSIATIMKSVLIKFGSLLLRTTHRLVAIAVQCGEKARRGWRSWTLSRWSPWIRRVEHGQKSAPTNPWKRLHPMLPNGQCPNRQGVFVFGASPYVSLDIKYSCCQLCGDHNRIPDNYLSSVHLSSGKWSRLVPGFVD